VYGITLEDPNGEITESVGGFYGSDWKENVMIDNVPEELPLPVQLAEMTGRDSLPL